MFDKKTNEITDTELEKAIQKSAEAIQKADNAGLIRELKTNEQGQILLDPDNPADRRLMEDD